MKSKIKKNNNVKPSNFVLLTVVKIIDLLIQQGMRRMSGAPQFAD